MRCTKKVLALRARCPANRLNALDPKRLDDSAGHAGLLNHEGRTKQRPKPVMKAYGTCTDSSSSWYVTAAVRSSLSHEKDSPVIARRRVLNSTSENSWR